LSGVVRQWVVACITSVDGHTTNATGTMDNDLEQRHAFDPALDATSKSASAAANRAGISVGP